MKRRRIRNAAALAAKAELHADDYATLNDRQVTFGVTIGAALVPVPPQVDVPALMFRFEETGEAGVSPTYVLPGTVDELEVVLGSLTNAVAALREVTR